MLKYETFPVQNDPRQPAVDSSTTLLLNNPSPTLLCAWSGGSSEGAPDTKIYLSRCEEGFDTYEYKWGSSEVIAEEEGQAHWTPILFKLPQSDEATLFYKVGPNPTEWHTRVKTSSDGGKTWSESRELVPGDIGGRGPSKNPPVVLEDGTIVAGGSIQSSSNTWRCFADLSTDNGQTWSRSDLIDINSDELVGEGASQPSVVNIEGGHLVMLARSSTGWVLRSDSLDGGKTWTEMRNTSLANPNSGFSVVRMPSKAWAIIHNPHHENWGSRTPLIASSSIDEGVSWKHLATFEDKEAPEDFTRIYPATSQTLNSGIAEFCSPTFLPDSTYGVHMTYTHERTGIKHVYATPDYVKQHSILRNMGFADITKSKTTTWKVEVEIDGDVKEVGKEE